MNMFNIFYQSHAGSWAILIVLFLLSCIFQRQKVTGILLKIFYLIMLVSGIGMLVMLKFPLMYVIKGLLAIVAIGMMEAIMGRLRRKQPTAVFWVILVVALALVILLGFGVLQF